MANQNKLKAYVRYDGTGRVIAGGPILQRFKPKVGNWVEIDASECCNYVPTTTTTTTQASGPTAWTAYTSFNASWSCQQINGLLTTLYSSTSTLTSGTFLFTDPELTEPYNYFSGTFVAINNQVWEVTSVNGPIENPQACSSITTTSTTTTTTTPYPGVYYNADSGSQAACNGAGAYSLPLTFVLEEACTGGAFTLAAGTWATYGVPVNGSSIYVNIGTGNVVQLIPTGIVTSSNVQCISCG